MLYTVNGTKDQDVVVDFNKFGSDGWELVSDHPGGRAVFKRKL
jgi:hypothetical protein